MPYVPINVAAYTASFAGAIAGMAVSGWITDSTTSNYTNVTRIAGAFAQSFDTVWNNATQLNNLEIEAITSIVQQDFRGRGPSDNPTFQNPNNWTVTAKACVALVLQSDIYFAGQGINPGVPTPPPPPAAASQLVWVSKGGNDTTGDGTDEQPFLTIGRAMTSIIDASVTKRYSIMFEPGVYTENILLKPNVFITGVQANTCRIDGTLDLDPSWAGPANNRGGTDNCVVIGTATFDLVGLGSTAGFILGQFSFFNGDVIFIGDSNNNLVSIQGSAFNANLTMNGGLYFIDSWNQLNGSNLNVNALAGQVNPTFVFLSSGASNGPLIAIADPTSSGLQIFNIGSSVSNLSSITLDGAGAQLFTDVGDIPPNIILLNGALAPTNAEATIFFGFGSPIVINPGMNTFTLDMTPRGVLTDGWDINPTLIDDNGELTTCIVTTAWANGVGTLKVYNPGAGFSTANSFDVLVYARKLQ
jgi:hypothetical protein